MLIFEPNHYSSLCAKVGDTSYDYFTGTYVGIITEVSLDSFVVAYTHYIDVEYRCCGTIADCGFDYETVVYTLNKFRHYCANYYYIRNRIKIC